MLLKGFVYVLFRLVGEDFGLFKYESNDNVVVIYM